MRFPLSPLPFSFIPLPSLLHLEDIIQSIQTADTIYQVNMATLKKHLMDAVDYHINHIKALLQYHPWYSSYQPPIYPNTVTNDIYSGLRYKNPPGIPHQPMFYTCLRVHNLWSHHCPCTIHGWCAPVTIYRYLFYDFCVLYLALSPNSSALCASNYHPYLWKICYISVVRRHPPTGHHYWHLLWNNQWSYNLYPSGN